MGHSCGSRERVSCNCYTFGGPLSFWDLHNKCWWTLAVHFKSYYVVIQLMEFNMSCISHLLQFWFVLVPPALKSCLKSVPSPKPKPVHTQLSEAYKLKMTRWLPVHVTQFSICSLLLEPLPTSLFACSHFKGLMCSALSPDGASEPQVPIMWYRPP